MLTVSSSRSRGPTRRDDGTSGHTLSGWSTERSSTCRISPTRVRRSPSCGSELLSASAARNCDHLARVGQLIAIGTYGTRDEAEVVQGLLASAGIEASIRADDAGGAFPFVLSGGAQVLVDESDAAAARELLADTTDET